MSGPALRRAPRTSGVQSHSQSLHSSSGLHRASDLLLPRLLQDAMLWPGCDHQSFSAEGFLAGQTCLPCLSHGALSQGLILLDPQIKPQKNTRVTSSYEETTQERKLQADRAQGSSLKEIA
eukprot:2445067-Rhodomonas_salina.1